MKLKPSLRNTVKAGLCFSSIALLVNCSTPYNVPLYKKEEIPYQIEKLCKKEYNLKVITKSSNNSLWIYVPLDRILHKDFGVSKDKLLDEEVINKLRNILIVINRVFLNTIDPYEFYCIVASDINLGIDYILIGNSLDIKKSYAGAIPWYEANRRYVMKVEFNPYALADHTGKHIKPYDINLGDFLAQQIIQRINIHFQDETLKKYFRLEKVSGYFKSNTFIFEYAIKKSKDSKIKIEDEIINIVAYVLNSYEFDDFLMVEIKDLFSNNKIVINKDRIKKIKQS